MSGHQSAALRLCSTTKWDSPVSYQKIHAAQNQPALSNSEYLRQSCGEMKLGIGPRLHSECPHAVTFERYSPNDDDCLEDAIKAAYRQVYGNAHVMDNECSTELEAQLRNGDINVRQFVTGLAKTSFYKSRYFESVSPQRGIELNFKHLLGRAPTSQAEVIEHIALLASCGYDAVVDKLVDSAEYQEVFGNDTVPYLRYFKSSAGINQSNFNRTAVLQPGFANSDRSIGNGSKTLNSLAKGQSENLRMRRQSFNGSGGMIMDGEGSMPAYVAGLVIFFLMFSIFLAIS